MLVSTTLVSVVLLGTTSFAKISDQSVNASSNMITPLAVPAGFNPLKGSDADLLKYGFPKKPTTAKCLAIWQDAMSKAKYYVAPDMSAVTAAASQTSSTNSPNWAGYVIQDIENKTDGYTPKYDEVYGTWTQPTYTGNTANPACWVGIGGTDGSGFLVQAGTAAGACNTDPKTGKPYGGLVGDGNNQFFVEDVPLGISYRFPMSLSAGDIVYCDVTYNAVGKYATAFFENETTGKYSSIPFVATNYDGTTADFITEPIGQNYVNWSTSFSQCCAHWTSGYGTGEGEFDSYNYQRRVLEDFSTGKIWATPSAPVNGGFSVTVN